MASTIIRNAILKFNFPGPVVVDLSCFTTAFEVTPSTEEIDIGTFCNPSATEQGRTTFSAVASFLWEPALYAALQPHVADPFLLAFAPDNQEPLDFVQFNSRYASQPWGRFEVGQRVEVELPLAVLSTPVFQDAATLEARLAEWAAELELPGQQPVQPEVEPTTEGEAV